MLVKVVSDDPGVQDWVIRQTAWNSDLWCNPKVGQSNRLL